MTKILVIAIVLISSNAIAAPGQCPGPSGSSFVMASQGGIDAHPESNPESYPRVILGHGLSSIPTKELPAGCYKIDLNLAGRDVIVSLRSGLWTNDLRPLSDERLAAFVGSVNGEPVTFTVYLCFTKPWAPILVTEHSVDTHQTWSITITPWTVN